jgi:hypothetical protein
MYAVTDNTAVPQSGPTADPTRRPASKLVTAWARGRRDYTPWAYPHLRGLAITRLAVGIFLIGVSGFVLSQGSVAWAVVPLAGTALLFAIASLDFAAARSVSPRN